MYNDLLNKTSMSEIVEYINNFFENFDQLAQFKTLIKNLYINSKLMNYIRETLINTETALYRLSVKQNFDNDKCDHLTPFCFAKRNTIFINDKNLILRCYDILENLKYDFFNIYFGNVYYSSNFVRKYDKESFCDSLYKKPSKLVQSLSTYNCCDSERLTHMLPTKNRKLINSTLINNCDNILDFSTSLKNSVKCFTGCSLNVEISSAIILRADHICRLKELTITRNKVIIDRKNRFYDANLDINNKYLGNRITDSMNEKLYKINDSHHFTKYRSITKHSLKKSVQNTNYKSYYVKRRCKSMESFKSQTMLSNYSDIENKRNTFKSNCSTIDEPNFKDNWFSNSIEYEPKNFIEIEYNLAKHRGTKGNN